MPSGSILNSSMFFLAALGGEQRPSRDLFLESLQSFVNFRFPSMREMYSKCHQPQEIKNLQHQVGCIRRSMAASLEYYTQYHTDLVLMEAIQAYQTQFAEMERYVQDLTVHCQYVLNLRNVLAQKHELKIHLVADDVFRLDCYLSALLEQHPVQASFYRGMTLRLSVQHGALQCLAYLLQDKLNCILQPDPQTGQIALHVAMQTGQVEIVKVLLKSLDNNGRFLYREQLNFKHKRGAPTPLDLLRSLEPLETRELMVKTIHGIISAQGDEQDQPLLEVLESNMQMLRCLSAISVPRL